MKELSNNELIYLYKEHQNKNAYNILIQKNFNRLYSTLSNNYVKTYYNLPLEREDLYSLLYLELVKSIELFNYQQLKYNFEQFSLVRAKSNIFRHVKCFLKKSESLLNDVKHYKDVEINYIKQLSDKSIDEKILEQEEKEILWNKIKDYLSKTNNDEAYKIIKFKMQGLKNYEIAKTLGLTNKQIANRIYFIFNKLKKLLNM